ncbi:MAG: HupE/UreJ family protein [Burkholderiaceae bacterium]
MRTIRRHMLGLLFGLSLVSLLPATADAHLMSAQRGTLNFTGNSAFMVVSLPVSAFGNIDLNGEKQLSRAELTRHRTAITSLIAQNIRLFDRNGQLELQDIMLALSGGGHGHVNSSSHLTMMGRFALAQNLDQELDQGFSFAISLFGDTPVEQSYAITASRSERRERHRLELTAKKPAAVLFPPQASVFSQSLTDGVIHMTGGLNHLVFLLVVIAGSIGLRQILLVLTAFTIGHTMTLTLSVFGWINLPSIVVGPAIAMTILAMGFFDWHTKAAKKQMPSWRIGLVFSCALIHGLGLASGFKAVSLQTNDLLISLIGFSLGIELAQVAVLALVGSAMHILALLPSRQNAFTLSARVSSLSAMTLGSFWLVASVVELG